MLAARDHLWHTDWDNSGEDNSRFNFDVSPSLAVGEAEEHLEGVRSCSASSLVMGP